MAIEVLPVTFRAVLVRSAPLWPVESGFSRQASVVELSKSQLPHDGFPSLSGQLSVEIVHVLLHALPAQVATAFGCRQSMQLAPQRCTSSLR
jgi:hypothetical protein